MMGYVSAMLLWQFNVCNYRNIEDEDVPKLSYMSSLTADEEYKLRYMYFPILAPFYVTLYFNLTTS